MIYKDPPEMTIEYLEPPILMEILKQQATILETHKQIIKQLTAPYMLFKSAEKK